MARALHQQRPLMSGQSVPSLRRDTPTSVLPSFHVPALAAPTHLTEGAKS